MANELERRAIGKLVDRAGALGVEVPAEILRLLDDPPSCTGAVLWARTHPDDDSPGGCCEGEVNKGAEYCTCWIPEWNAAQAPPRLPVTPQDIAVRARMCDDCAFRPGSPERGDGDGWMADTLYALPSDGQPFYCHDGMRRPTRWRHPDGRQIAGSDADWQPPMISGVPFRLDGRIGLLCAGWAAVARRESAHLPDEVRATLVAAQTSKRSNA